MKFWIQRTITVTIIYRWTFHWGAHLNQEQNREQINQVERLEGSHSNVSIQSTQSQIIYPNRTRQQAA